jgi:hypothetical protein
VRTVFIRAFLAAFAFLLAAQHASADLRIVASPGGQIGPYLKLFDAVRASGQRVIIDGPCLSACTLVLSTVPRSRICVTGRAVLGFHAAASRDRRGRMVREPEATAIVLATYPGPVRSWIQHHGGLTGRVLLLRGRELASMYAPCR